MPEGLRLDWCRALIDFPTFFPGPLIAEHWTDWMPLQRAGVTPMRALDLIVDGNRSSWPGGAILDRDGNIIIVVGGCRDRPLATYSVREAARPLELERLHELPLQRSDVRVCVGQRLDHDVDEQVGLVLVSGALPRRCICTGS